LRESEERFRQLAENIDVVFFMFDRSGKGGPSRTLYASPAYEHIWGRSREGLKQDSRAWLAAVHPDDHMQILEAIPEMERGEFNGEFRIIDGEENIRWIQYRSFAVLNEQGQLYRVAGIAEDISKRNEAENKLERNAQELSQMVH